MKNLGKKNNRIVEIIGAGFSGLSLAYFFVKQGYRVKLIEKTQRVGGVIHSFNAENGAFLVETAANGFLNSAKIEELFKDIGCEMVFTKKTAKKRYIFRDGKLHLWPLSLSETVSGFERLLWALLTQVIRPKPNEDLYSWVLRCANKPINDYLLQPMVNGIFATATQKLSAKLVFGSLFYKKRPPKEGRGLVSAPQGMQEVLDKLKKFLVDRGVEIVFQEEVYGSEMLHNSFIATSLISYLAEKNHPSISVTPFPFSNSLSANSLIRVTVSFSQAAELDGFGVLFPNTENFHSLGVLANTNIFPHRGDYNESWILGGSEHPEYLDLSDDEIKELILVDRARLFPGVPCVIEHFFIYRWKNVIPEYNLSLENFLNSTIILDRVTGNFLGVVGLSGIHERNYNLVKSFEKEMAQDKDQDAI